MTTTASTPTKGAAKAGSAFMRKGASAGLAACLLGGVLLSNPLAANAAVEDLGWTPVPTIQVIGSTAEKGSHGHGSIADLGVFPGQKVEYVVNADLSGATAEAAKDITKLSIENALPDGFVIDQSTIKVTDFAKGSISESGNYDFQVKDGVLMVVFSDAWIAKNVGPLAASPSTKLMLNFMVTVDKNAGAYNQPANVATQVVNDERIETLPATILIPGLETNTTVNDIAGKAIKDRVAVGGDVLAYKVKLDGTFAQDVTIPGGVDKFNNPLPDTVKSAPLDLAYDVNRFGIIEDFDEAKVTVDPSSVRVLNDKGANATNLFNITVKKGVLSVLAKTNPTSGAVPVDVLNKDYSVSYQAQVLDTKVDGVIVSDVVEVVNDREHVPDETVTVTVKGVSPTKSAVTKATAEVPATGDEAAVPAADESTLVSIPRNSDFSYKLGSSELPANRLSSTQNWVLVDEYTSGDRAQHDGWSVVAQTPIHDEDGKVLFEAGDVLADANNVSLFKAVFSGDKVAIQATSAFTALVNADLESSISWSAYVDATRTAKDGNRVSNTSVETTNSVLRTATVVTDTEKAIEVVDPVDPVDPTVPPVDPTEPPVDPTKPPVDPTDPVDPTKPPVDPTDPVDPVDPTVPPVDPTEKPTDPTVPPVDPTEKPVDPTEKPVDPTEKPVDPTEKPVDPTEKPVDPTEKPVAPTKVSPVSISSFVTTADGTVVKGDHNTAADAYKLKLSETKGEDTVVAGSVGKLDDKRVTLADGLLNIEVVKGKEVADTADKVVAGGHNEDVKVTFSIKNNGKKDLTGAKIVLTNPDGSTGELTKLTCETANDGVTSAGLDKLAVGGTALCTGVLVGVQAGTTHATVATLSATEVQTADEKAADAKVVTFTSKDEFHAVLAGADGVVVDTIKEKEKEAVVTGALNSGPKKGAITGEAASHTDQASLIGGALALLAAMGSGLWLFLRRGGRKLVGDNSAE